MIIITGTDGFIGGNLFNYLAKKKNIDTLVGLDAKKYTPYKIIRLIRKYSDRIKFIIHMGAITDTTLKDNDKFDIYNLNSTISIRDACVIYGIPLIYASSAATYGDGENGFDDEIDIKKLKPLNLYGKSKQDFDLELLKNPIKPQQWYGLKFFNVYGQGEDHKKNMASVVYHCYQQIKDNSNVVLFKSHNKDYLDGEQKRDFIYIDDVLDIIYHFMVNLPESGIYNVGTGKARTFNDLAKSVFKNIGMKENISYIDTPIEIRDKYQYFTEAKIDKLRKVGGYKKEFNTLEEGIKKYINILENEDR